MQWNLRLAAAQRGIWRSSDLRRLLAEAGLEISAGKMSHLWSGRPISVRLDDLDVICAVLGCEPGDLLIRDPAAAGSRAARRQPRPRLPSRRSGRPGAAAARCRRYEHLAAGHLHRLRDDRAGPGQGWSVQALLCPRPVPGAALQWLRAGPQAHGRGACAPAATGCRGPPWWFCPGCGELRPVHLAWPVPAVQAASRRQARPLPGLRQAGRAPVVGPLPGLLCQVPRDHRRVRRLR